MPKQYIGLGLSLLYPDSWTSTEESTNQRRQGVTFESPGGSFVSIHLLDDDQDPDGAVDEAAAVMSAEYEDIETEQYEVEIGGLLCIGVVQRFYFLDLVVASKLVTIDTDERQYLIQIQGEDRDMDEQAPVFDAILTSMVRSLTEPSQTPPS